MDVRFARPGVSDSPWLPSRIAGAIERPLRGRKIGGSYARSGSTPGTPGSDRLARGLTYAVACQSSDGRLHPDPAICGRQW